LAALNSLLNRDTFNHVLRPEIMIIRFQHDTPLANVKMFYSSVIDKTASPF
jgi:hypothetical protein